MQSNQHKRLARKLLRRFEPTWTGQAVNPTSAALPTALNTAEANPLPVTTSQQPQLPATSLALPTSIIEPVVPTSTIPPATQPQLTTSSLQPLTTSQAVLTTESTSSIALVTSSTESISSTTPLTTSAAVISTSATPVRTTADAPATTSRAAAPAVPSSQRPSLVRTSSLFTDSAGVIVETIVVVPAPTPTVSATETATPKSTGNAGTIVGAVAGGFVALICLIAFVSWIVRQHNKRNRGNHDDFDKQSYLRNSMMIPDEPDRPVRGTQAALALARSNTAVGPRPPTMIERKNTYYTHGQPSPSFAPGQVISFDPGQIVSAPGTAGEPAYPSPVAFAAYTPPEQHHQSELVRHPSGAQLLNRAPTNGGMYDHSYSPSPVSYPDSYGMHSPDSYGHDGYTYPMHPGVVDHRNMVQSVTAFQAEQYAEISRQLEADAGYGHESFHPISPGPGPASPVVRSTSVGSPIKESPLEEQHLPNPFDDRIASNQRIDSMPPALPVIEGLSRTGTPIDPNPQYAHWSYDGKAQGEGNRLSVAGVQMPEPPTPPAMAVIREDQPAHAPASAPTLNVAPQPAKRPVSVFDADDAYGGM